MPLKEDDGKIIGAIAINVDITDKKLIEKNLYKINHDMGERVKELRCLYKMSEFLKEERLLINSIADILSNSAERKKAEVALRDQAETFEAIIENTSDSVLLISPDFKLLRFNKTAQERLLQRRGEKIFIGADFRKFLYPDAKEIFHAMFMDSLGGKFCDRE